MSKEKYYFEEGTSYCYPLDYYKERIELQGEEKIFLKLAKREYGTEHMWCKQAGEIIDQGDGACGKVACSGYMPRNKISGICIHLVNCFEPVGDILIFTKNVLVNRGGDK